MTSRPSKGFSMIEVLVTIVILLIGLLGLAGLQARALTSQMESYQRAQALILLKDMADRLNDNRANAPSYKTTGLSPAWIGTGDSISPPCPALTSTNRAAVDLCEWSELLKGSSEKQNSNSVGAMIGARGCIIEVAASAVGTPGQYRVEVAWQGFNNTAAPSLECGQNQYPDATSPNEAVRRVVSIPVVMAVLR